ncbi:hypothetical protein BX600DRAFT_432565 [Xylariales sp. PMI_506]|nr:hypothetical protein BX600DRAFT_432565 [Xylariales sp. PMI_506]
MSWAAFPTEIQLRILRFLIIDGSNLGQLATVTRQWQTIIERHNFERINLTLWRIPNFGLMTRRNRALVKYIWLLLELNEYDCSQCGAEAGNHGMDHLPNRHTADKCIIMTALHDLFLTLSVWEPQDHLTLDLSTHSLSDSHHWFKYLTFGPDTLPQSQTIISQQGDPEHGWRSGNLPSAPSSSALNKVFTEVLNEHEGVFLNEVEERKWWKSLPQVPAITGILLRLQNRRRWRPSSLIHMFSRLPNLQEIHYEPWRAWSNNDQTETDLSYCSFFNSLTSFNLRKIVLFENFDEQYSSCFPNCDNVRQPDQGVARAATNASLQLQQFSASFIIDASHFLNAVEPSWNWPHLTTLTLTSQLLNAREASDSDSIHDMLEEAASMALKMPNLKVLQIWNGRQGSAALFKYRFDGSACAVLSWKATWKLSLRPRTVKAWEAVADAHNRNNYFKVEEFVDETIIINSHADAIVYLELFEVLRPVSLHQILTAHDLRRETVPQTLGLAALAGSRLTPTPIHKKPSFSAKYWAKALRYYRRMHEQYCSEPAWKDWLENGFLDDLAMLRQRGIEINPESSEDLRRGRALLQG